MIDQINTQKKYLLDQGTDQIYNRMKNRGIQKNEGKQLNRKLS